MKEERTLEEWREVIERERPYVNKKPYSHNIIGLALGAIDRKWGTDEVNKAIVDFKLEKVGWSKQ